MINRIIPGERWLDIDGEMIQAHGGGMLYCDGIYYWYGENKTGSIWTRPYFTGKWEASHTPENKSYARHLELVGVSCYSSIDLVNWKNEGVVLKAEQEDVTSDVYKNNVLERPKVIYNKKTGKFVMWMHIDTYDYQYARAGIAISDSPTGPFDYIGSIAPNGEMARDMTLYVDDDEQAYLFCSAEHNQTMHIHRLTDDYQNVTSDYTRNFIGEAREAPAVFKRNGKYYVISSGCTGWAPNPASYAVGDSVMGPFRTVGDPMVNDVKGTTFDSQSTYVVNIEGTDQYIFMADRWFSEKLHDSRYIWLPIEFDGDDISIRWHDEWSVY